MTIWTMRSVQRLSLIAVAACAFSTNVRAQSGRTASPLVYTGVGFEVTSQRGGSRSVSDPDQPNASVGGAALGMTATAGVRLSERLSLAAEVSLPTRFQAIQEIHYFGNTRYDNRHREPTVSLLLHVPMPASRFVRPEFVLGASFVREDTIVRTATAPASNVYGPYGSPHQVERDVLCLTGGVDVGIRLASHIQLVSQVRLHGIPRTAFGEDPIPSGYLYLSPFVFRAAIGLRTSF